MESNQDVTHTLLNYAVIHVEILNINLNFLNVFIFFSIQQIISSRKVSTFQNI